MPHPALLLSLLASAAFSSGSLSTAVSTDMPLAKSAPRVAGISPVSATGSRRYLVVPVRFATRDSTWSSARIAERSEEARRN